MKRLLLSLLFPVLAFGQAATSHAPKCGVELQAKKTSADSDWPKVDLRPVPTTVALLTRLPAPTHADLLAAADKRFDPELRVFVVQGYLVGFKLESDFDFHIVITDPDDTTKTMIVEMVSPKCVATPLKGETGALRLSWEARFGKATPTFKRVLVHKTKVEMTGVGFYDFLHGQTGVAPNGFELHRLIAWREVTN